MFTPTEAREFKEQIEELKFYLPTMCDKDARMSVGMLVPFAFERNNAMTTEVTDLVDEYKKLKPHLAAAMDVCVASGGTTEP